MTISSEVFIREITNLKAKGKFQDDSCLLLSESLHIIMPYHKLLDAVREQTTEKIGTTGRGIGPTYSDKAARSGLRTGDLLDARRTLRATRLEAIAAQAEHAKAQGVWQLHQGV